MTEENQGKLCLDKELSRCHWVFRFCLCWDTFRPAFLLRGLSLSAYELPCYEN